MGLFSFDWSHSQVVQTHVGVVHDRRNDPEGHEEAAKDVELRPPQTFNSAYLPISTSSVFDRFGQPYDAVRVLDTSRVDGEGGSRCRGR
jgi:hypothetical protein